MATATGTTLFDVNTANDTLVIQSPANAAYATHADELYRFALRELRDEGSVQDVVQEVFLRAWRAADSYDARFSGVRTWLFTIG